MVERKNQKIFWLVIFTVVFFLYFFFRFYNFDNRIAFGWDQEQYSLQVRQLLVQHRPVLIGPRTTNDNGFFLGPYFTYLITPFFIITRLHPNAIFLFLIFYNLFFFIAGYLILKKIFNMQLALMFLSFWSINPLMAGYDFTSWWPIYIPLVTLILWFLLKKIYSHNRPLLWFMLGCVLAVFIHMHVQCVFLVLFTGILLILMRKRIKPTVAQITFFILPILLSLTPLVLFDLRHQFLNSKAVIGFFMHQAKDQRPSFLAWIPVFANFIQPLIVVKSSTIAGLFYLLILILQIFNIRKKDGFIKLFYKAVLIVWLIFPVFFALYGQRPSEYYFVFLYPYIYLTFIDFFISAKKTVLLLVIFFLVFFVSYRQLFYNLQSDYYSLKYKDRLIRQLLAKTKGQTFNLSFTTTLTTDYGFRYLMDYYHVYPTGNWKDPLVQIKIPADASCQIKVDNMGVFIPKELTY